jgi:hypothetical protein
VDAPSTAVDGRPAGLRAVGGAACRLMPPALRGPSDSAGTSGVDHAIL